MYIYPAIYIRDGRCVKLQNNQNYKMEFVNFLPKELVKTYEEAGASHIYIVDMDGALLGHAINEEVIETIISQVSIPVIVGGGIRTLQDIEHFIQIGAKKVIIGTRALEHPAFIKEALTYFGLERIIVSIDAKDGMVVTDGWKTSSSVTVIEQAYSMKKLGIHTIIYMDISREYSLLGPNVDLIKQLIWLTGMNIVVAGGIQSLKDIEILSAENVKGIVIGNPIYDSRILLKDAILLFEKGEQK